MKFRKADAPKTSHCLVWILVQRHNWVIFKGLKLGHKQGEAVTVNGDRYRAMLNEFLFTKIEEEDIGNIWFDVLRTVFEDCIISRRIDVVWSPRRCDSTAVGHYLWVAVKDKCYADKPETIEALKDNIREAIDEIQLHTIDNVFKNSTNLVGPATYV